MSEYRSWTAKEVIFAALAGAFVLLVNGAVPFLMTPTLGQAVWTTGFAQSFANGALFDVYAHDFGIPKPAAIAFGLAGAWPASLLIRLGLHPADAYTGMVALWLGLAMISAYQIARRFGAARTTALLGASAWMSMPIIWVHAGYSMLSLGIALLSFYFMTAFRLFRFDVESARIKPAAIGLYFAAAIVSVFMDGYTFMMFAAGSSFLLLYTFISTPHTRPALAKIALPVHIASFALAYFLFASFIGKSTFESHPIDFFRAWGLDLSFLAIPTKGVLWLPDLLGFSLARSDEHYFGDASVWTTTFALPVLALGLFGWWRTRRAMKISTGLLIVALLAFYMALGPSLKVNSTRSAATAHQQNTLMPPESALGPTGNAWISHTLPGFKVMRSSYRWSALGVFCLWLLVMLWVARSNARHRHWQHMALALLLLLNLPHSQEQRKAIDNRTMFKEIEQELVAALRNHIRPAETAVFLPWRNDFFANYLAPRAGFRTFNIGGDKNLTDAQTWWPADMRAFAWEVDAAKAPAILKMLTAGVTDVVILPYFHMLWSPHLWPCADETRAHLSPEQNEAWNRNGEFVCPAERKAQLQPLLHALRGSPYVDVLDSKLYATIRLRPEFAGKDKRDALTNAVYENIHYPLVMGHGFRHDAYVLADGWHTMEEQHVWSGASARLKLPRPKACQQNSCNATLRFVVFGASAQRPVAVVFTGQRDDRPWTEKVVAASGDMIEVKIGLSRENSGVQDVLVSVEDATSPLALSGSPDGRILGIALQRIDLSSQQ